MKKLILSLALLLTSAVQAAEITVNVSGYFADPFYAADHRSMGEEKTRQVAVDILENRAKNICQEYGGSLMMIKDDSVTQVITGNRYIFSSSGSAVCRVDEIGQCAHLVVERNDVSADIAMDACRIEIERQRGEKQIHQGS